MREDRFHFDQVEVRRYGKQLHSEKDSILEKVNEGNKLGEVVDLFCGVGGLSHGLKKTGFEICAGYDVDRKCSYAFEKNNDADFFCRDVSKLTAEEIKSHFSGSVPSILVGCAPCQPFSTYKYRYQEDPQWNLIGKFSALASAVLPDFITMENVPSLIRYKSGKVFSNFINSLSNKGYFIRWTIAKCEEFGVPQKRRRLVILASRIADIPQLIPTHSTSITVREAIGSLPKISAGQSNVNDPLHVSSFLSEINMKRIQASKPGGTWRDWPENLIAKCHTRPSGKTYPGVYARMSWDEPSPTITTQCYGYGNGRFGHPEQDRAISLREAAILQSFPPNYEFLPEGERPTLKMIGRWIGNAVPVKLAEAIGVAMSTATTSHRGGLNNA